MSTFDSDLRDGPEFTGWEQNRAQVWFLEHEGRKYPPKKIVSLATGVSVNSFSGGPETNDFLQERGFQVGRLRDLTLSEIFRLILDKYKAFRATEKFAGKHEINELFTQARKLLENSDIVRSRPHLHVVASYGKGNWAATPWISLLDDRETQTTQKGTYVVYLFREDGKGCYVKLAQGVTDVEKQHGAQAARVLAEQAKGIREHCSGLGPLGFDLTGESDLGTIERLGKLYEASTIASKFYEKDSMPEDTELLTDLESLLAAYDTHLSEKSAVSNSFYGPPIALIGTWRDVENSVPLAEKQIHEKGTWASPWSFPIKEAAKQRLKVPFHLYAYSGNQLLKARLRVSAYETSTGQEGLVSPWPASTESKWQGIKRNGDRQSGVFKTWFLIDKIEALSPPLPVDHFELAIGLSSPENLLNQNSFGYVIDDVELVACHKVAEPAKDALPAQILDLQWLHDQTGLALPFLSELVNALSGPSPQIMLAGPPGTSKTWLARLLARYITQGRDSRTRFVQFHPGYSYESFVEGLRPVANGTGVSFELQPGVVIETVRALHNAGLENSSDDKYVIVIDEANRANLPRVLGELMFLFEYRNQPVRLQYSGDFKLPKNLLFIATMNTADRSIRSIDVALRRRFDVFELGPDPDVLQSHYAGERYALPGLVEGFQMLNEALTAHLDRHHTIGHAFFMRDQLDGQALSQIWRRKIFPLIEEFFFDQPELVREFTIDRFWPGAVDGI